MSFRESHYSASGNDISKQDATGRERNGVSSILVVLEVVLKSLKQPSSSTMLALKVNKQNVFEESFHFVVSPTDDHVRIILWDQDIFADDMVFSQLPEDIQSMRDGRERWTRRMLSGTETQGLRRRRRRRRRRSRRRMKEEEEDDDERGRGGRRR